MDDLSIKENKDMLNEIIKSLYNILIYKQHLNNKEEIINFLIKILKNNNQTLLNLVKNNIYIIN